jgi:uncharacterized protein YaiE (UPF0345 family)
MNTYDEPLVLTYQIDGAALDAAAELATFIGPKGKQGRVVSIGVLVTVEVTGSTSTVTVNTLDDEVVAGSLVVPVGAADTFANDATLGGDATLIPADTAFTIDVEDQATAGDGNIVVAIAWF